MEQENQKNKLTKHNSRGSGIKSAKGIKNNLLMRSKKGTRGITLIALVITIIVLLILAGVTIATLLGDNGIITKATTAKEKTQQAGAVERVQMEVQGSYGRDGTIDLNQLNSNLKNNITGLTYNEKPLTDDTEGDNKNRIENLPAIVTLDGYSIVINADGSAKEMPKEIADIIANPKEYYGKEVTNYKASDDDKNTYRIFYVDKKGEFGVPNTIYLKADYSSQEYNLNDYASYDNTNTKVREMNPDWAKARGDKNIETSWNVNEKAAAYLCIPVNATNKNSTDLPWKSYYDENAAEYVIGGPSVEMYVKSYNEAYKGVNLENEQTIYTLGANYSETNPYGYKYTVNGNEQNNGFYTNNDTLDCTKFNSMYCRKNGSKTGNWWLASPSALYDPSVCCVRCDNASLANDYYSNNHAVSPLVSLRSNFIPKVE